MEQSFKIPQESKISFPEQIVSQFGSIEGGIEWFKKNLQKEPIDYRLNLQVLQNLIGQEEEAFTTSNQLLMIAPDDPRVLFNRGWHLIHRGQFSEGFGLLENGRNFGGYGDKNPISPMPILHREMPIFEGSHILMHTEGGFGDEIINFRFIENIYRLYNLKTIVACQRSLVPLFSRHPHVAAAVDKASVQGVYHDYWIPGMSSPARLCENMNDVSSKPYLFVENLPHFTKWHELIDKNRDSAKPLKIGLRWSGSPKFEHQQYRKFPANLIIDLAQNSEAQFYSFQRDNDMVDLPESITDLAPFMDDWADTACGLAMMDLVITSCTSIAHCSAALGVPTWVIVPVLPYYIWAPNGRKSPWYDSVKLFRQEKFSDWTNVEKLLSEELPQFISQTIQQGRVS